MMKGFIILCLSFSLELSLQAQLPEDALRMSYARPSGTAREQAIGGAMGSIGGDLSANYVNPAGLGFYKTGEVLFSPGFAFHSTNSNYLSTGSQGPSANNFLLGTSGIVYGWGDQNGSTAISLAVNRSADFNGNTAYKGLNAYSSGAEAYAEEFKNSGLQIDQALSEPGLSYGTRMALYTYLIDTSNGGQGPIIVHPDNVLAAGGQLSQSTQIQTSGGVTEIVLGVAGSTHEKWYLGLSLGFPIVNFQQNSRYTETDLSGNGNNNFESYTYNEYYSSRGAGVNGRVGVIYRPNLNWRIGLAIHTPSFYSLTDKVSGSMVTNTEAYAGIRNVESSTLDLAASSGNSFDYNLQTPWHILVSGSYIFPGQVSQGKMGFITGDVEYIANAGSRFSFPLDENGNQPDNSYFDPLNNTIKSYYRNTLNFRMGGEYKVNELAFRIGGSYAMNPYSDSQLKAYRASIGGGLGYRKKGIIIDLTYVEALQNDVNFPYRLSEKSNTYATVKQYTGNMILSFGMKF